MEKRITVKKTYKYIKREKSRLKQKKIKISMEKKRLKQKEKIKI